MATTERNELWGGETTKAVENFPVSGEPIPVHVARWLGRIKGAAARVNAELGLLDADKAERIAAAAERIAAGELDDQFPIDVFQTGSGTSSNMNANEVLATLAGEGVHANDDVNMGQSSNDVFPSAIHLAALEQLTHDLLPALDKLATALEAKARDSTTSSSRVAPIGWMRSPSPRAGVRRLCRTGRRARSASRRRSGVSASSRSAAPRSARGSHAPRVRRARAEAPSAETGLRIDPPAEPFESQAARDALVEASGALKTSPSR